MTRLTRKQFPLRTALNGRPRNCLSSTNAYGSEEYSPVSSQLLNPNMNLLIRLLQTTKIYPRLLVGVLELNVTMETPLEASFRFSSIPGIRRCGCSVVKVSDDGSLIYGASFNLPGFAQTVPRGETYCLLFLIDKAEPLAVIEYITDNKGVHDLYNKGPAHSLTSNNCELYQQMYEKVDAKALGCLLSSQISPIGPNQRKQHHNQG